MAVFAPAFVVLGVVMLDASLDSREDSRPVAGGVRTTGVVVASEYDEPGPFDKNGTHVAVVEFTATDGEQYRIRNSTGGPEADVGSEVEVSYDPDDPAGAHDLTTNPRIWGFQLAVAVVALLVGVPLTILAVRRLLSFRASARARRAS